MIKAEIEEERRERRRTTLGAVGHIHDDHCVNNKQRRLSKASKAKSSDVNTL